MTDMNSYAPAFASPSGGDTTGAVRTLAAGRLNSTRKRIVKALAESGQEEASQALLSFVPHKGSAWRPETGLALSAHRSRQNGLAALQLAAAYAGMKGCGQIDTYVDMPQWLYLDGWLTPVHGRCGLKADGQSISIDSNLGSTSYQYSASNRWLPVESAGGPWTAVASGGLAPRYVTLSGLRHSVEGFPWISETPSPAPDVSTMAERPGLHTAYRRIAGIEAGWDAILSTRPSTAPGSRAPRPAVC